MTAQVFPAGQVAEHVASEACPCRPSVMVGRRSDGSYGREIVHQAAGGTPVVDDPAGVESRRAN